MNMAQIIVKYAGCIVEVFLIDYFFRTFQERRLSKRAHWGILAAVALLYGAGVSLAQADYVIFSVSVAATLAIACCYRFKWYATIFMTLIFSVISLLSELIVSSAVSIRGGTFEEINADLYVYIVGLLTAKIITYCVALIIRKAKHKSFQSVKGAGFFGLMALPCSSIIVSLVFSHILLGGAIGLPWKILSVFAIAFPLAANVAIFYIVDRQYELISSREKLKASQALLENQRQYYEDVFQSQQEIRKTRHDLKNIFIALLGALNAGDTPMAKDMIQRKLDELGQSLDLSDDSDNMIDSILHAKKKDAQRQNIRLEVTKKINQPLVIDHLDAAVLIANLLDNAIEATSEVAEDRKIFFSILTDKDSLIVLSCNPTINTFKGRPPASTKKDKKHHGFGLPGIQAIAEKYHGTYRFEYEYENGTVITTTVLRNQASNSRTSPNE